MDRPIIYTQEQVRSFDLAKGWQRTYKGLSREAQDILGGATTVVVGLSGTATTPASLDVNLGVGSIYQNAALDPTAAGALPADGSTYFLQGILDSASQVTLSTSALSSGQSQWALIEAAFAFSDVVPSSDPSGGILPFYNATNPSQPLQGQGGSGAVLNTERLATITFKAIYGSPATTGSQTPPNADSGYVGLYLILLTYGQTTITNGEILVAGPSVGTGVPSNYSQAPFLAGLLNQHHLGIPGQAPKIDLTKEVKNVLASANFQITGTFIGTLSGPFASTITGTFNYIITGNKATIYINETINGVATTASTITIKGLPTSLVPAYDRYVPCISLENDSIFSYSGVAHIYSLQYDGIIVGPSAVSGSLLIDIQNFSDTGECGLQVGWCIEYPL